MAEMNLSKIVVSPQGQNEETDHFAQQLMELLREHVPAPQKSAFMARLSAIMGNLDDRHPARVAVFNEVHKRLGAENRQR